MARIVVDGHVRIVDAINTKEFSRSAIIRAVSAIESGRAVAKPGRPELFNEEDKNIIVGVIKIESLSGTSLNAKRTRELMESVLSDKKRRSETDVDENTSVSKSYPYLFAKRNSELKASMPRNVDIQRLSVSNQQVLLPFYELLQNLHNSHHYSPSLIFNTDESSLRLSDSFKTLVIHPTGVPAGFHTTPTNMPNATLVVTAAADGYSLKSIVLWPCHKLPKEMRVLLSAFIDVWDNNDGWMTESIFQRYAEEVLLTGIIERRKIIMKTNERCLLLLDSHSSRAQPDIWQKFADNNIDVVTFIPHSSHITQPLDRGVFAVLKKCINSLYSVPPDSTISLRREAISNVLPQALQTALLPATVVSSFKKSGVLSNEWHSVLSTLPKEPSVTLKKRTHRFDFYGKIITEQKFLEEWKKEKKMKEDKKRKENSDEKEEKILFAAEKPQKRRFNKSHILNDDILDDESKQKNSRKIVKRELVDYV
ncbi:putative DDE superfamily endonuclease [Monocercomonoides exilis]|uniref:putative DDE superfamily endonuclease n=1 Tax=Monocercomonoides exilis TaxID=2049356 RepID=UPI00355A61CE|nr:putative DDE superfamily endonuclease [Monocercomonoides exilis]|eukprot:MONOS_3795.1-p1 / transcript=MONOS_3795.1 / gene=MONOS_3795 / organism=Monocercomonoides_exilis_PA203 / gene_product=unspecified product / transcript_product=unspecified product / location=Mono_scaffold00093:1174-2665(+) / protein_length=479 / sequence_SO=supercontig / SO=protein_coding / is_pseudo=false